MRIIARGFDKSDIEGISRIFDNQNVTNRLPGLRNVIINSTLVDEETGNIVGYGVVNIFAETTMVLDSKLSKRERIIGFRELMKAAILYCKDAGIELLYSITNMSSFEKILCNKYGFSNVPGALLVLDLYNDNTEENN